MQIPRQLFSCSEGTTSKQQKHYTLHLRRSPAYFSDFQCETMPGNRCKVTYSNMSHSLQTDQRSSEARSATVGCTLEKLDNTSVPFSTHGVVWLQFVCPFLRWCFFAVLLLFPSCIATGVWSLCCIVAPHLFFVRCYLLCLWRVVAFHYLCIHCCVLCFC